MWRSTRPGSSQLAVDSDAALMELVRAGCRCASRPPRRRPRRADQDPDRRRARRPGGAGAASFDVVIGDVFAGAWHAGAPDIGRVHRGGGQRAGARRDIRRQHRRRAAAGAYQGQDRGGAARLRPRCLIADAPVLRGRRFGNLVLAAACRELPVAGLTRRVAADPFPARLLDGRRARPVRRRGKAGHGPGSTRRRRRGLRPLAEALLARAGVVSRPPGAYGRGRRKLIIAALTSAGRSCWVQCPQPGRITDLVSLGSTSVHAVGADEADHRVAVAGDEQGRHVGSARAARRRSAPSCGPGCGTSSAGR